MFVFPVGDQVQYIMAADTDSPRAAMMTIDAYADRVYVLDVRKKLKKAEESIAAGKSHTIEEVFEDLHEMMERGHNKSVVSCIWKLIDEQSWGELSQYFAEDARIYWRNSKEVFTVDAFVRANAEYPGDWKVRLVKIMESGDTVISVVHVQSSNNDASFHATSFFTFDAHMIVRLEEYWSEDGAPPAWRIEKQVGRAEDASTDTTESAEYDEEMRIIRERHEARQCGRIDVKHHRPAVSYVDACEEILGLVDGGEPVFLTERDELRYVVVRYDDYMERFVDRA